MYRSRASPTLWIVVAVVGICLLVTGLVFNVADGLRIRSIQEEIANLGNQRAEWAASLSTAEEEFSQHAGSFARHWSEEFAEQLQESAGNLKDNGRMAALLSEAQT